MTPPVTIRRARLEDRDSLLALVTRFLAELPYGPWLVFERAALEAFSDGILCDPVALVLVAEAEGQAVGLLVGVQSTEPITGAGVGNEIVWWVEPAYRRTRAGPLLLGGYVDWCRQQGLTWCKIATPCGRIATPAWCKITTPANPVPRARAGFTPIETVYLKRLT